jgi:hypothetical protein
VDCAAGLYGATSGLSVSSCTANCSAGYFCAAGSTNATASACPMGRFSLSGSSTCTNCSAGRYGSATARISAACTAPCPAGTYGATEGLTSAGCSGNCSAGHACVAGSTNATAAICAAGRYSVGGAGVCSACPAGTYGATAGLPSAACSGNCSAGYACPVGSTNATASICPVGKFSVSGSGACTNCSAGRYGSTTGLTSANCSNNCTAGAYGNMSGLSNPGCSGQCPAGYACPAGSTNATGNICPAGKYSAGGVGTCTDCPTGNFGNRTGGTSSAACFLCRAGSFCGAGSTNDSTMCGLGQWSRAGASSCVPCPLGTSVSAPRILRRSRRVAYVSTGPTTSPPPPRTLSL